jgi:ribose-phosphate pyrophosphokinase
MTVFRRWRHPRSDDALVVLAGSASRGLTEQICSDLGITVGRGETLRFGEGTLFVRILDNVRGRSVFVVQSTGAPVNDNFMELVFWIDAAKRASAASVTAVVPYLGYSKGDKKDEPRVSIRARVCADALEAAGVDRVVTMDLHAPQIQGFFRVPVDDLYARPRLCAAIAQLPLSDPVVVAPDAGFAKRARRYALHLGFPLAIADKARPDHSGRVELLELIGDVDGKDAVIVDDVVLGGSTLVEAAGALRERGARSIWAAVTHPVLSDGALERIEASPIERLVVTDTVDPPRSSTKLQTVAIAPLFAEAIRRIDRRESISVLFEEPPSSG